MFAPHNFRAEPFRRAFRPDGERLADDTSRGETNRVAGAAEVDIARGIHTPRRTRTATTSTPQTHGLRRICVQRRNLEALEFIGIVPADGAGHAEALTPIRPVAAFHVRQLRISVHLLKRRQEERIVGVLRGCGETFYRIQRSRHLDWFDGGKEEVVGTITAVDTFLGVLLGISTAQYNKENAPLDDD